MLPIVISSIISCFILGLQWTYTAFFPTILSLFSFIYIWNLPTRNFQILTITHENRLHFCVISFGCHRNTWIFFFLFLSSFRFTFLYCNHWPLIYLLLSCKCHQSQLAVTALRIIFLFFFWSPIAAVVVDNMNDIVDVNLN